MRASFLFAAIACATACSSSSPLETDRDGAQTDVDAPDGPPAPLDERLIPSLQEWTGASGQFVFGPGSRLVVDAAYAAELGETAETVSDDLLALAGLRLVPVTAGASDLEAGDVFLTLGSTDAQLGDEGYALTVGPAVRIEARTATGAFFGTRTLLQMLRRSSTIPAGAARDWPRYPERGLLAANEPVRFSNRWWRDQIRQLSYLKLNMLWLYVGYGPAPVDEMQEIAAFARRYHITVIPQFNMPGHLENVLTGHPELHLPGRPASLDLSKQVAYDWARDKLDELVPAFDTPHWHLGSDEYLIHSSYAAFPQLEAYAKEHYGPDATGPDTHYGFINFANEIVREKGLTMRIWNDGISPSVAQPVDKNVIIEHWIAHGTPAAQLLDEGYRVQNSNLEFTYYDLGGLQLDPAKIYDVFRIGQFHGSAVPDEHPGLLGSKLHIWTGPPPLREPEPQIDRRLVAPESALTQLLWGSPKVAPSYADFAPIVDAIGHAPGNSLWLSDDSGLSGRAFVTSDTAQQHVFASAGTAGGVLHWWYSEASAATDRDRWAGGEVVGQPIGFAHGIEQHVFARSSDDALLHWSWSPGQMDDLPHLDDWGAAAGSVTSSPAGYAVGDQQHVFYRAADGALAHRLYDRSDEKLLVEDWGGELAGAPLAFVHGGEQHVFARAADGSLRHWSYAPGLAAGSRPDWAGPGAVTSDLTGYAIGDQQHVFYRAADGSLEHRFWDRSAATLKTENWGGQLVGTPVAFVQGDEHHVFARGVDGSLQHWWYAPGLPTVPARDTWAGPGTVTADPTGYAIGDQQHVVHRAADGTLTHRFYDRSAGQLVTEDWGGSIPE